MRVYNQPHARTHFSGCPNLGTAAADGCIACLYVAPTSSARTHAHTHADCPALAAAAFWLHRLSVHRSESLAGARTYARVRMHMSQSITPLAAADNFVRAGKRHRLRLRDLVTLSTGNSLFHYLQYGLCVCTAHVQKYQDMIRRGKTKHLLLAAQYTHLNNWRQIVT